MICREIERWGISDMKLIVFLLLSVVAVIVSPISAGAINVNIGINIGAPAPLAFEEPPDVVVVPSGETYVYMVPNMTGVYFYDGYWYRFHRGHWFRSTVYNGSWGFIETSVVPAVVVDVPPEYPRYLPHDYHRIHYADFDRHWRGWERERHWHGYGWYKKESRADVRREREHRIEREHIQAARIRGEHVEKKGHVEQQVGTREYREGKTLENQGAHQESMGHKQKATGALEYKSGLAKENRARQLQKEGKTGEAKVMMREGRRDVRQGAGEIKQGNYNIAKGGQKEVVGHNDAKQGAHEVKKGSRDVARGQHTEKIN